MVTKRNLVHSSYHPPPHLTQGGRKPGSAGAPLAGRVQFSQEGKAYTTEKIYTYSHEMRLNWDEIDLFKLSTTLYRINHSCIAMVLLFKRERDFNSQESNKNLLGRESTNMQQKLYDLVSLLSCFTVKKTHLTYCLCVYVCEHVCESMSLFVNVCVRVRASLYVCERVWCRE